MGYSFWNYLGSIIWKSENELEKLSDKQLIEAYFKARKLNLDRKFSDLLKKEINRRGLLKFETPRDKEQS